MKNIVKMILTVFMLLIPSMFFVPASAQGLDIQDGWYEYGGGVTDHAVDMAVLNGRLYQVHSGTDGRIYLRSTTDGQNWNNWQEFGGTTTQPVSMTTFNNKLFQTHKGDDRRIYTRYSHDGINWSTWSQAGGTTNMAVDMAVANNKLYQVHRGDNKLIYTRWSDNGVVWSEWHEYGGGTTNYPITFTGYNNKLYQSHVGEDGKMYTRESDYGTVWTNWHEYGGGVTENAIDMTTYNNKLYQVHKGDDKKIYIRSSFDGKLWDSWKSMGGYTNKTVAMHEFKDRLFLSARAYDRKIRTRPTLGMVSGYLGIPSEIIYTPPPRKEIIINIGTQRMQILERGKLVLETPVITGRNGFATPRGNFSVINKLRNVEMSGERAFPGQGIEYEVFSKYWLGFTYQAHGIHDAGWRSSFGGNDYIWNGSHGCVNAPEEAMSWLYRWAEIGIPVKII
jgi:hypothetical protein